MSYGLMKPFIKKFIFQMVSEKKLRNITSFIFIQLSSLNPFSASTGREKIFGVGSQIF